MSSHLKKGLEVGIATATAEIDSITSEGGVIRFFSGGIELKTISYSSIYTNIYYVKTGGDDTKSGLTDEDAWAHHPWMSTWTGSTVLVAGDVVNMNRGDTWSISNPVTPYMTVAQSGSTGKPITTTAYGTGADPIIKIATATDQPVIYADAMSYITFDNLHIQHHGSTFVADEHRNGFEMWNTCHDFIFTNNEISNIPASGIIAYTDCYNITIGNINATTTATTTAYSNHIHDFGYSGIELHGVDPISGESNFNVYYNYIHDATRTVAGQNEYGITFDVDASSTDWPKYATARFNNVQNIDTWQSIGCHGGSYIYFQDNYVKNFGVDGIIIICTDMAGLTSISDNNYIERNTIEQASTVTWVTGNEDAFAAVYSQSATVSVTNCYVRDNLIFYTSRPAAGLFHGMRLHNVDGLTVDNNNIYNGALASGDPGIYVDGALGNLDLTISNNIISQWGPGVNFTGSTITGTVNFVSNIIASPQGDASFIVSASDLSATSDVFLYNNTFINAGAYNTVFESDYGVAAGGALTAKNNIFGTSAADAGAVYWKLGTISGTLTVDYNQYWNSTNANPFYYAGSARNWSYWTGTVGADANSPNVAHGDADFDPLFVNVSGWLEEINDFKLGFGSPAINAGTNTGVTTDYYGNPRVGNYDIGAIEKQ